MPTSMAESFMRAVQEIERSRNVEPLVALFEPDAEVASPERDAAGRSSSDGIRAFWNRYLSAFGDVRSTFTHVREGPDFAVLEWSSEGTLANGDPIRYPGVSIVEHRDGKVSRFSTYYDSAAFLPNGARRSADRPAGAEPHEPDPKSSGEWAAPRTDKPRAEGLDTKRDAGRP